MKGPTQVENATFFFLIQSIAVRSSSRVDLNIAKKGTKTWRSILNSESEREGKGYGPNLVPSGQPPGEGLIGGGRLPMGRLHPQAKDHARESRQKGYTWRKLQRGTGPIPEKRIQTFYGQVDRLPLYRNL